VLRLMGMAKDTDVRPGPIKKGSPVFGQLSSFIQNVADRDLPTGDRNHCLWWKSALFVSIDVAGDGGHRSNRLQLLNHGSLADVTGVNNMIHIPKILWDGWIKKTMRIGKHTDPYGMG
jgi:hypothetical protein